MQTVRPPVWVMGGTLLLLLMGTAATISVKGFPGTQAVAQTAETAETAIPIRAKRFEYTPKEIVLKKGVPVILELTSEDVLHGFNLPDLNIRADVVPGQVARVRIVPDKTGTFSFHCDNFCGVGHEQMEGVITVID